MLKAFLLLAVLSVLAFCIHGVGVSTATRVTYQRLTMSFTSPLKFNPLDNTLVGCILHLLQTFALVWDPLIRWEVFLLA